MHLSTLSKCWLIQFDSIQFNSIQFNSIQFNSIQSTALSLSIVIRFVSCSFPSKVGYFVHHTYIVIHPLLLAIQIQNLQSERHYYTHQFLFYSDCDYYSTTTTTTTTPISRTYYYFTIIQFNSVGNKKRITTGVLDASCGGFKIDCLT